MICEETSLTFTYVRYPIPLVPSVGRLCHPWYCSHKKLSLDRIAAEAAVYANAVSNCQASQAVHPPPAADLQSRGRGLRARPTRAPGRRGADLYFSRCRRPASPFVRRRGSTESRPLTRSARVLHSHTICCRKTFYTLEKKCPGINQTPREALSRHRREFCFLGGYCFILSSICGAARQFTGPEFIRRAVEKGLSPPVVIVAFGQFP